MDDFRRESQTLRVGTLHDFTGVGGSGVAVNESTESPQGADESTVVGKSSMAISMAIQCEFVGNDNDMKCYFF